MCYFSQGQKVVGANIDVFSMSASAEHTFCANNLLVVNLIARLQITNSPTYPDNCRWAHDNHERGAFVVWDVLQKNKGMVRQTTLGMLFETIISKLPFSN